jgi:hypothetical protein
MQAFVLTLIMEGKGVKAEEIIGILMSEEIIGLNRWNSASCTAPTPTPSPPTPSPTLSHIIYVNRRYRNVGYYKRIAFCNYHMV